MEKQYFYPQRLLTCVLVAAAVMATSCAKTNFVPGDLGPESFSDRFVKTTEIVALGNKQVDFLLVLDDSNSMLPELQKLSARMSTFVSFLEASQIDWQMCVTTTRASNFGSYLAWKNYSPAAGVPLHVLKKNASGDLNAIFTSTINSVAIGGGDSGDERAIKSAYVSFQNKGPCYRPDAAVSVVVISDEDERSVGGDPSRVKAKDNPSAYQPLEAEDLPETLMARARASFGNEVRFTFNSIVVKPGDGACESMQDVDTSPSHSAYVYTMLSNMTEGGVGSICDGDYSANLNTFKDKIVNSLNQVSLQCEPVDGVVRVWINKVLVSDYKREKNILKFGRDLVEGTRIDLVYECP